MRSTTETKSKYVFTLENLLVIVFAFWPLFQNIWTNLRLSIAFGGVIFPIAVTWIIGALFVILHLKWKLGSIAMWLPFLMVIVFNILSGRSVRVEAVRDLSVYVCAFIFYTCADGNSRNKEIIIKSLFICGLFISTTVILDSLTHIFKDILSSIYTDGARTYKQKITLSTGGILPSTSAAGCYIVSGLASYITMLRYNHQHIRLKNWIVISAFIVAFLIIRKRSFLIAGATAIFIIGLLKLFFESKKTISIRRVCRNISLLIVIIGAGIFTYSRVALVREYVDVFISKILSDDKTMSGRSVLYALAFQLYSTSPIIGIGWAQYRTYTKGIYSSSINLTYDAHNVYLQLICETGIVGIIIYVIAILTSLIAALRQYRVAIVKKHCNNQLCLYELGIFLQIFFLLYSISGNPLYDHSFFIVYFFGIFLSVKTSKRTNNERN